MPVNRIGKRCSTSLRRMTSRSVRSFQRTMNSQSLSRSIALSSIGKRSRDSLQDERSAHEESPEASKCDDSPLHKLLKLLKQAMDVAADSERVRIQKWISYG